MKANGMKANPHKYQFVVNDSSLLSVGVKTQTASNSTFVKLTKFTNFTNCEVAIDNEVKFENHINKTCVTTSSLKFNALTTSLKRMSVFMTTDKQRIHS